MIEKKKFNPNVEATKFGKVGDIIRQASILKEQGKHIISISNIKI